MAISSIEWTEMTWNPTTGCDKVSAGCKNCYAMKMAARLQSMPDRCQQYDGTTKYVNGQSVWTGKVAMAPDSVLHKPLKRKKPTTYFVNSMGDLFHEDVPFSWIDKCFEVMEQCGLRDDPHIFQILTKRSKRMLEYMHVWYGSILPPDNIWLGVSAENQKWANERIPHLLETPAATRFVSLEPQLEMISLWDVPGLLKVCGTDMPVTDPTLEPHECAEVYSDLDGVIQGCESGYKARPFHKDWSRDARDCCEA